MSDVKLYPVPAEFAAKSHIDDTRYQEMYQRSIEDPEGFWAEQAEQFITWFKPWDKVLDWSYDKKDLHIKWFEGGKLNVCYNCIDRHLDSRGDQVAIIWESDDPTTDGKITYRELHEQVSKLANVLGHEVAVVAHAAEVEGNQHPAIDGNHHVDELALSELEAGDRTVELDAITGIVERGLVAGSRRAHHPEEDPKAGLVETRQRALHTDDTWQDRVTGKPDVVQYQFGRHRCPQRQLLMNVVRREPGRVGGNDEAPDPLVGASPHHGDVGDPAVGDPHLGAVEHPVAAVAAGMGAHTRGVTPRIGFGQPKTADALPRRHLWQPLGLLLLRTERPDRIHRERALHGGEAANCAVAGLELHTGKPVLNGTGSGASVSLQVHTEQAEGAHLPGQFRWEDPRFEPVGDVGKDALSHESTNRVSQEPFLFVEEGVDAKEVKWIRSTWLDGFAHPVILAGSEGIRIPVSPTEGGRERETPVAPPM